MFHVEIIQKLFQKYKGAISHEAMPVRTVIITSDSCWKILREEFS
jgi:hypothetical protein